MYGPYYYPVIDGCGAGAVAEGLSSITRGKFGALFNLIKRQGASRTPVFGALGAKDYGCPRASG